VKVEDFRVKPGTSISLAEIDPDDTAGLKGKDDARDELKKIRKRISAMQERLWAEHRQSLLVVLQATDTGGKDGTIKHVFKGINPQGCRVWGFKVPSQEEADHDVLWRYHRRAPAKGMITVFNRSQYEEVLVVRAKQLVPKKVWEQRYEMINQFEEILARSGTRIIKFYLHISKDEQKERLQARLDQPDKRWKFSIGDLDDRARSDDYQRAFEDAINRCSTDYAPWYVIPANHKWARDVIVARAVLKTLEDMNPRFPPEEPGLDEVVIPD
jgi:PPK2 family polyphosphate:nucleotide phosphotransferase